jgi:hypothetical protein
VTCESTPAQSHVHEINNIVMSGSLLLRNSLGSGPWSFPAPSRGPESQPYILARHLPCHRESQSSATLCMQTRHKRLHCLRLLMEILPWLDRKELELTQACRIGQSLNWLRQAKLRQVAPHHSATYYLPVTRR